MNERLPGIYEIKLYSSDGRQGRVSVFLIPGGRGGRSLLIDTGFQNENCQKALSAAFSQLEIELSMLDVFVTHKHHDHCGLAGDLARQGAVIYMNPVEDRHNYDCLSCDFDAQAMNEQTKVLKTVGVTPQLEPEIWNKFMETNKLAADREQWVFAMESFPYRPAADGQIFSYGEYELTAISLPGHTLGQMGLYDATRQILFCADQIIDGIVPIVATTHPDEHLLAAYFESLEDVKHRFAGYTIIPSHQQEVEKLPEVVDTIALSYLKKLDVMKWILDRSKKTLTVNEIACAAYGLGEDLVNDEDFIKHKMVISKTFSCLEYLLDKELVRRLDQDGTLYWESTTSRYHYEAFSAVPGKGNPAGVVLNADILSREEMQGIARGAGFNETAFVLQSEMGDIRLRYFTPGHEMNLCGHATVASLYCLYEHQQIATERPILIETRAGILSAHFEKQGDRVLVHMAQAEPEFEIFTGDRDQLAAAMGIAGTDIDDELPIVYGSTGTWTLLVPIKELSTFKQMKPNNEIFPNVLKQMPKSSIHPFCLEAFRPECQVHSRHFSSPYSGTTEDPVTGTASGVIGCYYANYVQPGQNSYTLTMEQGDEVGRAGTVLVKVNINDGKPSVSIAGTAVSVGQL